MMNRAQVRIVAALTFALAMLVCASAITYAVIDYAYPTDVAWIESNLTDSRVWGPDRLERAKKAGLSERVIALLLAERFFERRERYMRLLLIGAPALALVMILVASGLFVLRREGTAKVNDLAATSTVAVRQEPAVDTREKPSFFGWGRARRPVLWLLWASVLAAAFEQLYHAWAGSDPPKGHGGAMAFMAGILAGLYAPSRRFIGMLWFFLGFFGSIFAIGFLSGFVKLLR